MTTSTDSTSETASKTSRFDARILAVSALAIAAILPLPHDNRLETLPWVCPFLHLTGCPCPFCGLTRSLVCCAHGQWGEAWRFHLLGPPLFAFLLGSSTRWAWEIVARRTRKAKSLAHANRNRIFCCVVALAFGAAWVFRLANAWPLPP